MVKHDIKTKQIKAEIWFLGLARSIEVSELWLDREDGLDHNLLNLVPNLLRMPPIGPSIGTRACQLTLQDILHSQLVLALVELGVVLVQRIIGEMDIVVLEILIFVILFTGKPHETIVV